MAVTRHDAFAPSIGGRRLRPTTIGLGVAMLLGSVALLLAFVHVLQGAVEQGGLRHKADARHADATWRCNALRGSGSRESCLAQLGPVR